MADYGESISIRGHKTIKSFTKGGVIYAKTVTTRNGDSTVEEWFDGAGQLHRLGGLPAYVESKDGRPILKKWYTNGEMTRED